jgi:thymidylate synthase ThyX
MTFLDTSGTEKKCPPETDRRPRIYSLAGIDPEVHAYAMAKYSRSGLSMRQALEEISQQKAKEFLSTFYFQYGHRSIADLAHLSFAIEDVSMLAAIAIVDEQRWDGQERSSRYQDFKESGYVVPPFPEGLRVEFTRVVDSLFEEYDSLSRASIEHLSRLVSKPDDMSEAAYKRTIRARAFDNARYLLPLATRTSVGQIVNARTLENQISRLASEPHEEVQLIGKLLKESAASEPYNLRLERLKKVLMKHPEVGQGDLTDLLSNPPVAPTLVKYAGLRSYDESSTRELKLVARSLLEGIKIESVPRVTLVKPENLEIEIAATLVYEYSYHPYVQIVDLVSGLSAHRRQEIIELGLKYRGQYDEVSRPYAAGYEFQFDILMDIGGFRDLHRHRRCIQILQDYTAALGWEVPDDIDAVGRASEFRARMESCVGFWRKIDESGETEFSASREYVLPLAFRRRALFKMDLAEFIYICELRSAPGGHISYRRVAYDMYLAARRRQPGIVAHVRVHDIDKAVDLLKR